MVEAKDWVVIFPLLAGVVLLVSLAFSSIYLNIVVPPFVNIQSEFYFFKFEDESLQAFISFIGLPEEYALAFFLPGLIVGIITIIGAVLLIISAIRVKFGNKELKKAKRAWLGKGISLIISQIIFLVALYITFQLIIDYISNTFGIILSLNLLEMLIIGNGMILVFIGGSIAILGYIIATIFSTEQPIDKKENNKETTALDTLDTNLS